MFNKSADQEDYSAPLVNQPRSARPWRVVEAIALDGFRFSVRFKDGLAGVVDMSELISSPRAGVFATLKDPARFAQLFVENGVVTWPGELDLAPDAMYRELTRHAEWRV